MANEFIARKGLIVSGSTQLTGSLNVSRGITGSLFGTSSWASNVISASFATTASFAVSASWAPSAGVSSIAIDSYTFTGNGSVSNYTLDKAYDISSLTVTVGGLTQTSTIHYTLASTTLSFLVAPPSQSSIFVRAIVNVSTGSVGSFSGSLFGTASFATSASFATTASFAVTSSQAITSSFATTASAATSITFTPLTSSFATTASVANASTLTGATLASGVTASSLTSVGTTLSVNGVVVGRGGSAVATNTVVGTSALNANTTGQFNTAIGYEALTNNTTADNNTATGQAALRSNTTGGSNTAIGQGALYSNTTGNFNTATGQGTLLFNTTGGSNTAVGQNALRANTTGNFNTAIGYTTLAANTTGISNTAIGNSALNANTTGNYNTAIGNTTLYNNTTGISNTAIGQNALAANTTGNYSTATGEGALGVNTTGTNNTATGQGTLYNNTTGGNNTAIGQGALYSNTAGAQNTAIGQGTLLFNTTGDYNTATGKSALAANTTGTNNTADGYQALTANTTGYQNVGLGGSALSGITTGYHNVAVGYLAGANLLGGAGSATTNTASVFLGHSSRASASGNTNEIVIGAFAEGNGSNSATYGNVSMSKHVFAAGNVGVGTISPGQKLHVQGHVSASTYTSSISNGVGFFGTASWAQSSSVATSASYAATASNLTGGIANYIPLWASATLLSSSTIYQSAGNIGIGVTPSVKLEVGVPGTSDASIIAGIFGKTGGNAYGSTVLRVTRYTGTTDLTVGADVPALDLEYNSGGSGPFRYGTFADAVISNESGATNGPYGAIHFATSGSIGMTIGGGTLAGKVGIGTTSPTLATLQVAGSILSTTGINIGGNGGFYNAANKFGIDVNGAVTRFYASGPDATTAGSYEFHTIASDGTPDNIVMTISNAGNLAVDTSTLFVDAANNRVGIGTATPAQTLQVSGGKVLLDNNQAFASLDSLGTSRDLLKLNASDQLEVAGAGAIINSVLFKVLGIERLRLNSSGSLGIGTATPSASLHVVGTTILQGVIEQVKVTASAPPSTLNFDALSGSVLYQSASSANNWTINFRGSAATSLNSIMYPGQSMTFAVLVNHSSVGYTASVHQVDGTTITPRWQGGTLPSGSGTSTDIYSYTLIKTANAAFNIFASQTKFA